MPIEIRELIIKTEISMASRNSQGIREEDLYAIREKLLEECKRIIVSNMKKDRYKR
jgi:hypothetical protein